jgi:hypothetical protein
VWIIKKAIFILGISLGIFFKKNHRWIDRGKMHKKNGLKGGKCPKNAN